MNIAPHDLGDQWQGLEPDQPRSSRAAFWVAILAALLLVVGALALGAFLLGEPDEPAADASVGGIDTVDTIPLDDDALTTSAAEPGAAESSLPAIAATATLPGLTAPAAEASAVRLGRPPIIDANLDEWGDFPISTSAFIVYSSSSWDGSDDLSANWQLAWDSEALYIVATVTDDIHAQNQTGNTIFRGDSLEMQIDTNRSGDYGPAFSPDDFQITFSPGDFAGLPPSAFRFQGTVNGDMLDAVSPDGIRVASLPTADGYVLEAAIPWRDLNTVPAEGLELGLSLNANDNDQPGTAVQELMKSNTPNREFGDPTTWGILRLR